MTGNLARILHAWRPQVALRSFERRIGLAPRERYLGSVRRECLDHFLIFHEKQLCRLLMAYAEYFNHARPHQGIQQQVPVLPVLSVPPPNQPNQLIAVPVLGGLHHDYQRAA